MSTGTRKPSKAPLTQDHEVYTTVHEVVFFTLCRLRGGLCRLRDKTGTIPKTSCSLRHKPCSLRVRADIFWLFKNFHELHTKFDLQNLKVFAKSTRSGSQHLRVQSCRLRALV